MSEMEKAPVDLKGDTAELIGRRSVLFRIAVLCSFSVFLALLLFVLVIIPYQRDLLEHRLESIGQAVAISVEQVTMNAIVLEDYSTVIEHCLKVVRETPLVLYLVVTRPNGDSFIHLDDGWSYRKLGAEWQPAQPLSEHFIYSELVDQEVYHCAHAFSYAHIAGGWIHVGLSTEEFAKDVQAIYVRTIALALACMAVVLVVSLFFARRVSRPMRQLDAVTRQVAEGNLHVRATIEGSREIAHLAHSFNQMTEALALARGDLEQRIATRTAELQVANEQLQQEIEERRQAERELVRLERLRALGEMSAGISHNLNNLLVGIVGPVHMLIESTDNPEDQELLDMIAVAASRATDLVRRLHQAVHQDQDVELGPVALNQIVGDAVLITRPRWKDESESQGVHVEVETDLGEIPDIAGTEGELHHVLINLIFNAVDAMPEGGCIVLRTWLEGEEARLSISDDGVGMDEETSRRVFDPFFTTKKNVGTGLGLSTVYGTLNRWGGRIEVESRSGHGTCFILALPLWRGKRHAVVAPKAILPPSGARLLVIDDEVLVSKLLERRLGGSNEVHVFASGVAALDAFAAGCYDVALVDLGLQDVSGAEVARRLRAADSVLSLVLISGWDLKEGDPRRAAFDFYVRKPFADLAKLDEVVHMAVELRRKRAQV